MKTITLSITFILIFSMSLLAQKPIQLTHKSVVAESLAAHKNQNPFQNRAYTMSPVVSDTPSVKAVEKSFYAFDDLINLGEDFLCLPTPEFEPVTHFAKKAIIQKESPVFDKAGKTNRCFDNFIDLGEGFQIATPESEPATHLAKKDIIQRGNPFFEKH